MSESAEAKGGGGLIRGFQELVEFRNIVIHQYRDIDCKRVEDVVRKHADDLIEFTSVLVFASSK